MTPDDAAAFSFLRAQVLAFDHVGILVEEFDGLVTVLAELLGGEILGRELDGDLQREIVWLSLGGVTFELIRRIDPKTGAVLRLAPGEGGVHHVAITVADAAGTLSSLRRVGITTRDAAPRRGARGSTIGFLAPSPLEGTLIEVVEHTHAQTW